jgi:hypothetical protein
LTDKYKNVVDQMDDMSNDMKNMGSSILQAKTYVKKD